ncbi:MAG TPA: DNRLRE domain-containing protein [Planctomycetota bacterium]|nr:DNRLRE domain-containing protein [Planctomycetota bacterium]
MMNTPWKTDLPRVRSPRPLLLLAALALFCVSARADVLDVIADRDNTMYEDNGGTNSNGQGDFIFAGTQASHGLARRALVRFDVSSIPSGATVHSAAVSLRLSMTISGSQPIAMHRLVADWGEGASDAPGQEGGGAPAAPGDATWLSAFHPSTPWLQQGGDFEPTASAETLVGSTFAVYTWADAGLAADVQAWIDGAATNHGWVFKHADELAPGTAKRFNSRHHSQVAQRPRLVVDYTPACGNVTSYCSSNSNSTGQAALLSVAGAPSVSGGPLDFLAGPVPDQPGIVYFGGGQVNGGAGVPFGNGMRCVNAGAASVYRLPVAVASGNLLVATLDFGAVPGSNVLAGSVWNFQAWYRDPVSGGAGFDLSDALTVTFCP